MRYGGKNAHGLYPKKEKLAEIEAFKRKERENNLGKYSESLDMPNTKDESYKKKDEKFVRQAEEQLFGKVEKKTVSKSSGIVCASDTQE